VSVQFGAALATKLFSRVGPAGAVTLRLVLAAVVLVGLVFGARHRRPSGMGHAGHARASLPRLGPSGRDWAVAVLFGLVMAAMNLSFYEAIARVPLGVAVTVEFSGPLALALGAARRWSDGLWALGAGAGVALLLTGAGHHLDLAGLALALLAGTFWAAYIFLSKETGRRFESLSGLALAMSVGGLAVLPWGLMAGRGRLSDPGVLALGASVALLSSVVPYSLELLALRRVSARAFGVMMSLDPAMATAAGLLVLGQHLDMREWLALALVAGANLGNTVTSSPGAPTSEATVATP
jgi:inner membrane transporter RhtA